MVTLMGTQKGCKTHCNGVHTHTHTHPPATYCVVCPVCVVGRELRPTTREKKRHKACSQESEGMESGCWYSENMPRQTTDSGTATHSEWGNRVS